jgi:hypothetical protein
MKQPLYRPQPINGVKSDMRLFERDFTVLTDNEKAEWEKRKLEEVGGKIGNLPVRKPLFYQYPKAARHYMSLFPNNYLDPADLIDQDSLARLANNFKTLFNSEELTENKIQEFIRFNAAYFIIGSLLKDFFPFGHHDAFLVPEFQLGTSHRADYLLIGRSSDGYEFAFVELENPLGRTTLKNGDFGDPIRKGTSQIEDWEAWLEANYISLRELFNKIKHPDMVLPEEFMNYDRTRMNFVAISGRRKNFQEKTYRLKRKMREQRTIVLHYDNLIESAFHVIGHPPY